MAVVSGTSFSPTLGLMVDITSVQSTIPPGIRLEARFPRALNVPLLCEYVQRYDLVLEKFQCTLATNVAN